MTTTGPQFRFYEPPAGLKQSPSGRFSLATGAGFSSSGAVQAGLSQPRSDASGFGGGSAAEQAAIGRVRGPRPNYLGPPQGPQARATGPTTGGQQLQMFMTPREIHAGWQPLDADREDLADRGFGSTVVPTVNPHSTGSEGWKFSMGGSHPGTPAERPEMGGRSFYRSAGGQRHYQPGDETDEDLWARKVDEAQYSGRHGQHTGQFQDPNAHLHTGGSSSSSSGAWGGSEGDNESLYDSIARKGVLGPVHLGHQIGSTGKPQIVGGHHRIAAQTDIDPDQPIPVQHWEDFWHARHSPGYA